MPRPTGIYGQPEPHLPSVGQDIYDTDRHRCRPSPAQSARPGQRRLPSPIRRSDGGTARRRPQPRSSSHRVDAVNSQAAAGRQTRASTGKRMPGRQRYEYSRHARRRPDASAEEQEGQRGLAVRPRVGVILLLARILLVLLVVPTTLIVSKRNENHAESERGYCGQLQNRRTAKPVSSLSCTAP